MPHRLDGIRFDLNPFRGFVCLWIVTVHLLWPGTILTLSRWTNRPDLPHLVDLYRLGVECFLVLSGFLFAHTLREADSSTFSVRQFLTRRFFRLILPYQAALGLFATSYAVYTLALDRPWKMTGLAGWVACAFGVGDVFGFPLPDGSLWSMQPMFQFYLFWAVGLWVARRGMMFWNAGRATNRAWSVMTAATLAAIPLSVWQYAQWNPRDGVANGWALPRVAWLIAFGCVVYWVATRRLSVGWMVFACTVMVGGNLYMNWHTGEALGHSSWGYKAVLAAAVLTWLARGHPFPDCGFVRSMARVGTMSFSIYLSHKYIALQSSWIIETLLHVPDDSLPLVFLWNMLLALGGGYVFYVLVESRVSRFCQQFKYYTDVKKSDSDRTPPLGITIRVRS